jgi:unconventional prefoldin RPB5 interactor 1
MVFLKFFSLEMNEIERLEHFQKEHFKVAELLKQREQKISEKVMVPLSQLAFIPGEIYNTNQVLVSMGDNWFVEQSCQSASQVIERRQLFLNERIKLEKEAQIKLNQALINPEELNEEGEKFIEIRENVEVTPEDIKEGNVIRVDQKKAVERKHLSKFKRDVVASKEKVQPSVEKIIAPPKEMDSFDKKLLARIRKLEMEEEGLSDEDDIIVYSSDDQDDIIERGHIRVSRRKSKVTFSQKLVTEPVLTHIAEPKSILSKSSVSIEPVSPKEDKKDYPKKEIINQKSSQILKSDVVEEEFSESGTGSESDEFGSNVMGNQILIAYHRKRQQLISAGMIKGYLTAEEEQELVDLGLEGSDDEHESQEDSEDIIYRKEGIFEEGISN